MVDPGRAGGCGQWAGGSAGRPRSPLRCTRLGLSRGIASDRRAGPEAKKYAGIAGPRLPRLPQTSATHSGSSGVWVGFY